MTKKSIAKCAKKILTRRPIASKTTTPTIAFPPHRNAMRIQKEKGAEAPFANLARPERFELPTTKFVAWYSIQLSYGREEAELLGLNAVSSTPKPRVASGSLDIDGEIRSLPQPALQDQRLVCANVLFDRRLPSRYPSRPRTIRVPTNQNDAQVSRFGEVPERPKGLPC
jgi:hypothetical protein